MKRLLLFACCLIGTFSVSAQISGTNVFLQGAFLEIGEQGNGAFGAGPTTPAGYHPHGSTYLAEVYDWGHDGWTVGTPEYMGDYTYPGSPFEGWEIQIGTGRAQAFQGAGGGTGYYFGGTAAAGWSTGGIASYSNVGGSIRSIYSGSAGSGTLQITQETRVDTFASAVVVTTVMKNLTGSAAPNVYYMRSCDPDNDESWGGLAGCVSCGFSTNNTVVHQNEDARHRVMVKALGLGFPGNADYLALATKDCRAKAFIYNSWPLSSGQDLAAIWAGTYGPATYAINTMTPGDIGIGLVYNLGNIAANDSAVISYAYVFNGDDGIDSAFPDPQIVINGIPHTSWAPPTPNYDTFDVCNYPGGLPSLPVTILNATDKDWSWSHWSWSPSVGLSATTGTSVTINTVALPNVVTYTITGTDSASGMASCNNKVFYLTVITCNGAVCNSPCVGDSLLFNAPGDSTDATYIWFGPAPSTTVFSTTQTGFIFPATMADTGVYTVIKSVLGVPVDTNTTTAHIHPLPVVSPVTSQTRCAAMVSSMTLGAGDDIGTTYSWTGPLGFTSTDRNPVLAFDSTKQGTYSVHVISSYGCASDGSVDVWAGVVAEYDSLKHPGCPYDSVLFTNLSHNGDTYSWDYGTGSSTDFVRNPPEHIFTGGHHSYSVVLTVSNSLSGCSTPVGHYINLNHEVHSIFSAIADTICDSYPATLTDASTASLYGSAVAPLSSYVWSFGDGTTETGTALSPINHTYPSDGLYHPTLTVIDNIGCTSTETHDINVLKVHVHTMSDTTFCLVQPLALYNTEWITEGALGIVDYGFTYSWSPSDYLSSDTAHVPLFDSTGTHPYTLTVTINNPIFNCQAQGFYTLHSILPRQLENVTPTTTIMLGGSVYLNADSELNYTWTPNDGSLSNPSINNPVATPTVTTTYTVYGMDYYGCRDTATVLVIVDSTETEDIPTGFSPNGDGLNDVFRPLGQRFQRLVEMRVFNRWGECVFATNDIDKGWDGTYKGVPQDMGTYSYSIIVARPGYSNNIVYKGTVTLIR